MDFFVGQKIVAIKNHSQLDFKKGDEFFIKEINIGCCIGSELTIDIGISYDFKKYNGFITCRYCGKKTIAKKYIFYNSNCFSPLIDLSETTYDDVMQYIEKRVNKKMLLSPKI